MRNQCLGSQHCRLLTANWTKHANLQTHVGMKLKTHAVNVPKPQPIRQIQFLEKLLCGLYKF